MAGFTGRHAPDSVDGMLWTRWTTCPGFGGRFQPESADLAWRSFVPLINRYWLHNFASTHNYRQLFNMDISGGMPAVLIMMLVGSEPGEIRLLPAVPEAWPRGTIEGILARGQVEIQELTWEPGAIEVTLLSEIDHRVTLRAPWAIDNVSTPLGGAAAHTEPTDDERNIQVRLPPGRPVALRLTMR